MKPIAPDEFAGPLAFGDLVMDVRAYRVRRGGELVHLGTSEFRLLHHFLSHPRQVFTRDQLLEALWSAPAQIDARTVDAHILRLRRALAAAGGTDLIRTVRSIGYSLDEETG